MEDVVLLALQVLSVMAALLSLLFLAREAVRRAQPGIAAWSSSAGNRDHGPPRPHR